MFSTSTNYATINVTSGLRRICERRSVTPYSVSMFSRRTRLSCININDRMSAVLFDRDLVETYGQSKTFTCFCACAFLSSLSFLLLVLMFSHDQRSRKGRHPTIFECRTDQIWSPRNDKRVLIRSSVSALRSIYF